MQIKELKLLLICIGLYIIGFGIFISSLFIHPINVDDICLSTLCILGGTLFYLIRKKSLSLGKVKAADLKRINWFAITLLILFIVLLVYMSTK